MTMLNVDGADENDEKREAPIHLKTETNGEKLKIIRLSKEIGNSGNDANIDEIVSFQDGRLAAERWYKELFELNPKDIDYNLLKGQHEETILAESWLRVI